MWAHRERHTGAQIGDAGTRTGHASARAGDAVARAGCTGTQARGQGGRGAVAVGAEEITGEIHFNRRDLKPNLHVNQVSSVIPL